MSVLALFLLAGLRAFTPSGQEDAWAQLWAQFERLRGGDATGSEVELLRTQLMDAARASEGKPRGELLRAGLESLGGREGATVALRLADLEPDPFIPHEHWFLADLLPRGPARARAVLAALQAQDAPTKWQLLLAWNTAVDEARALRLAQGALPIQQILSARFPADWSSVDLALTQRLLGDADGADNTLAEGIAREQAAGRPVADLWSQRGIIALGFGDEPRARDYLGRALAQGSNDAGLVLARMDLMAGRSEGARRGFRALLHDQPPPDWAWRGWGTTLLPLAASPPVSRSPSTRKQ